MTKEYRVIRREHRDVLTASIEHFYIIEYKHITCFGNVKWKVLSYYENTVHSSYKCTFKFDRKIKACAYIKNLQKEVIERQEVTCTLN